MAERGGRARERSEQGGKARPEDRLRLERRFSSRGLCPGGRARSSLRFTAEKNLPQRRRGAEKNFHHGALRTRRRERNFSRGAEGEEISTTKIGKITKEFSGNPGGGRWRCRRSDLPGPPGRQGSCGASRDWPAHESARSRCRPPTQPPSSGSSNDLRTITIW